MANTFLFYFMKKEITYNLVRDVTQKSFTEIVHMHIENLIDKFTHNT